MRGRPLLCALSTVVVLAACATSSSVTIGAPGSEPPQSPPDSQPEGTDTQTSAPPVAEEANVAWGACEESDRYDVEGWECGTIDVPLDYASPDGEKIIVALSRLPASDEAARIGSLFVNPGGPGVSGLDAVHFLSPEIPDELTARFDLVGFDPRGVGASTPVDCIADEAKDAEADLDPTPDNPGEVTAIVDRLSASAEGCAAAQGDLLPYVGTVNAARDLDRLRQAVGDDLLTYLGYSYGTSLGAIYADFFPDRVRALVLDGAVDPSSGVDSTGEQQGVSYGYQDFEAAFTRFAEACAAATECAAAPDPQALLDQVQSAAEVAPIAAPTVEAEDGRRLTSGLMGSGVRSALHDTSSWPFLAVGLRDAADGDGSTLIRLADNLNQRETDGTWENFRDALRAITCADFPDRPTSEEVTADLTADMGKGENAPAEERNAGCLEWPETAEDLPVVSAADTATILVIGTEGDPATPYALAGDMADALGNAVLLTWEGDGHTAFPKTTCVNEAVTRYLIDLQVPAEGTRCPADSDGDDAAGPAYALDRETLRTQIEEGFKTNGTPEDLAECIAQALTNDLTETELVHFYIGLDTESLSPKLDEVASSCGGVFGS